MPVPVQIPVVHTTVFAAAPGGGNPCPVCFDPDGLLTTAQMQELAARFGHETAFVLKPSQPGADLRLRYFVPNHEMEMCIHATVGTITVLVEQGSVTASPVRIETPLGIIGAEWNRDEEDGVIAVMVEQFPPTFFEGAPDASEIAAALGIPHDALDSVALPIQAVSTARPKLMVPLRDYGVLDALQPDFEKLWEICERYRNTGFYAFTLATRQPDFEVDARQFPLRAGYYEDPATGVAACALAAYLTRYSEDKNEGWNGYRVAQGFAMGRPSTIRAEAFVGNGAITATRVGGNALILGEEIIFM